MGSQQTFVLLKTSFILVFKRRLQDVLIKTNIFALLIRLQKTSWSRPIYSSWSYVFKTSSRRLAKTSSRRFQDVFKTSCKNVFKTSSRRLQDVFKTPSRRLWDVLKTSSRHLQYVLQRCLQSAFRTYNTALLKFSRYLQDVFTTFLRRTAKIDLPIYLDRSI